MTELLIPYAICQEILVDADTAEKGQDFSCPSCGSVVVLKRGLVKVAHFAHKPDANCNPETVVHKIAKILVETAATKPPGPTIRFRCQRCAGFILERLPGGITRTQQEFTLPSGFRPDVVLFNSAGPLLAVEVRVTHAVDDHKAETIEIPFIEVDGEEILEKANVWTVINQSDQGLMCERCKGRNERQERSRRNSVEYARIARDKAKDRLELTTWNTEEERRQKYYEMIRRL